MDGALPLPAIRTQPTLARRQAELAAGSAQLEHLARVPLLDALGGDFDAHLARHAQAPLAAAGIAVLQINLGKLCNQTCAHCHVDAGPDRPEAMGRATAESCLAALAQSSIPTVDITGGAPELNAQFRFLVEGARALGRRVIDRCNLTVLTLPRCEDLPDYLAAHEVEVVASLPHYRELATDRQRGEGVHARSIEGLKRLNSAGYGRDPKLRLVLVTNPVGAFLPGGQASLEAEWKRELLRLFGIRFDALYTITNMPISRYLEWLESSGNLANYLQKLVDAFNPAAALGVMCRTTLSVGWDGRLYDCDFNQMLELPLAAGLPARIEDFDERALGARRIATARHCFGCSAGAGSSCGGALT